MTDKISTIVFFLLVAGCTEEVAQLADAEVHADAAIAADSGLDAGIDAGIDAGEDGGIEDAAIVADPCTRNDAGRCAAVTWTSTTGTYPVVVDHHTAFIAEGTDVAYLTIAGGIRTDELGGAEEVYSTVRRAKIEDDGTLGAWEDTTPLPYPLAFHAMTVYEKRVYFLAGVTSDAQGPGASVGVLYGDIDATGTVTEWKRGPSLPLEVRLHASAQVVDGRLYLIGGSGSSAVVDKVNFTTIDPVTGAPGEWTDGPPLPTPRSHHATVLFAGRIFVLAGFDVSQHATPAVLRSIHGDDGAITGWEQVGELSEAPWTASSFVYRNYVYLVGGGQGSGFLARFLDRVRFAPINPDLTIGAFEDVDAPLPIARSHVHHTPVFHGRVYSVGGRKLNPQLGSIDNVFVGALAAP